MGLSLNTNPDYGAVTTSSLSDDVLSCNNDCSNSCESVKTSWHHQAPKNLFLLCGGLTLLALISSIAPVLKTFSTPIRSKTQLSNPLVCGCINDDSPCKSLLLLRHAKSSWKNSYFVDDINRHLSTKGIAVAHDVGKSLHHMKLKLPELILSSPSIRTEETLNIVLGEWILGADAHDHRKVKKLSVKVLGKQHHDKLNKKLREEHIGVSYIDELYTNQGYLSLLAYMINHGSQGNDPNRVLVVGHNPAMEKLLNEITPYTQPHFTPGQFYEM